MIFIDLKEKKKSTPFCEIYGDPTEHIHHKDHNQYNDIPSNVMSVCKKCHYKIHKDKKVTSYYRKYGYTLKDISKKFSIPPYKIAFNYPSVRGLLDSLEKANNEKKEKEQLKLNEELFKLAAQKRKSP